MNRAITLAVPGLMAAVLAYVLSPLAARLAIWVGAVDAPGDRKIHAKPMPRLGGLAVVVSCLTGLFLAPFLTHSHWLLSSQLALGLGLGLLPVIAVSIADDMRGVRAWYKLIAHGIGAAIAVYLGVSLGDHVHLFGATVQLGVLRIPLSMLWIMGVTNAFNLIDGLDGLSAGLALIAAIAMGAVFALLGQTAMAGAALVLAGALVGFLPYNVYPAKMFLGDTGATAIGFCLAAFSLKGGSTLSAGFAALVPIFVMSLPIADTLIAILRRVMGRLQHGSDGCFTADSNHIHHRLLALGIHHAKAVYILYGAGFFLAAAAFLSIFMRAREAALVVAALLIAGCAGIGRLGYDEFALIRRGTFLKIYDKPALQGSSFAVFVDLAMVIAAVYLAIGLKTDDWALARYRNQAVAMAALLAPLAALVFWRAGFYKGTWKLAQVSEYMAACLAAATVAAVGLFIFSFSPVGDYYVTAFSIYGLISVAMVGGSRASYRVFFTSHRRASADGRPVIIYGAGRSGARAVEELFNSPSSDLKPVAFIDDDASKKGRTVGGLPVLGGLSELSAIVERIGAKAILVAAESIPAEKVQRTAEVCRDANVGLYRLNLKFETLYMTADPVVTITPAVVGARAPVVPARALAAGRRVPVRSDRRRARPVAGIALAVQKCPSCEGVSLHRTHSRTLRERWTKNHSFRRLYRCDDCAWRGWLTPLELGGTPIQELVGGVDLDGLDIPAPVAVPVSRSSKARRRSTGHDAAEAQA